MFFPAVFLLGQPGFEIDLDLLGEGDQFIVLVHGEADKGNEIREDAFGTGSFDFGFFQGSIGLPELGFVPEIGRLFDGLGQFFDVIERQPGFVGFAVEHLKGGDFVFVVLDELFEGVDDAFGSVQGFGTEPGFDDLILADVVDGDFVVLFDGDQEFAQFGIVKGFDGVLDASCLSQLGAFPLTPALSLQVAREYSDRD